MCLRLTGDKPADEPIVPDRTGVCGNVVFLHAAGSHSTQCHRLRSWGAHHSWHGRFYDPAYLVILSVTGLIRQGRSIVPSSCSSTRLFSVNLFSCLCCFAMYCWRLISSLFQVFAGFLLNIIAICLVTVGTISWGNAVFNYDAFSFQNDTVLSDVNMNTSYNSTITGI